MIFCRRHRGRCLLFFFVVYRLPLRRMPCTFLRKCRSGLRGSALSFVTVSDGKPCSGVRGDQKVSTASYSSCAGSGTGCGLFAEALYGFCCFRRFGKEPCLMKKALCEKAGVGRYAVRSVRGGQRIQLPHVRQQMCTHPAHGQCDLRGAAWPVVGRGRGLCGLAAAQSAGSGQPDGLPRQHVRRTAVRPCVP